VDNVDGRIRFERMREQKVLILRAATQYILILAGVYFFCKSNLLTPTGMLTGTIVEELIQGLIILYICRRSKERQPLGVLLTLTLL
jgi:hypothetical protein